MHNPLIVGVLVNLYRLSLRRLAATLEHSLYTSKYLINYSAFIIGSTSGYMLTQPMAYSTHNSHP